MSGERQFPFTPTSATQLMIGDLIGVRAPSGRWACLQVVDLEPRARVHLWAGLLDWAGDEPPTAANTAGADTLDAPITRIELFTRGGFKVVDNRPVTPGSAPSNRTTSGVGTITQVSGFQARVRAANDRANGEYKGWMPRA